MIGIFDSGVGGLSVFREIVRILPEEKYIYWSDNAHCPYGEKSRDYIIDRTRSVTSFLIEQGADIIVVACNTATAAAINTLREEFPVPFIGMEPAVKPAAQATRSGVVGVLATAGTLRATKYIDTRANWAHDVKIVEHIGQGFVELVEKGNVSGPEAESIVEKSVRPLIEAGADTISKVAGVPVTLIDPAPAVAKHLMEVMQENGLIRKDGFSMSLHSSGEPGTLEKTYNNLI